MLTSDKLKQKTCKSCGKKFKPFSSLQKVCSVSCSLDFVQEQEKKKIVKEWNRETKRRKQAIKSRGDWLREVQAVFNRYIRYRDIHLPCISCGRHHSGQYHAGHYKSVGANPELRFDERNCHKQCAPCNNHLSGNIANYRINLIKKVGAKTVEWLEGPHEPKKYTIEELKDIRQHFKEKIKQLSEG